MRQRRKIPGLKTFVCDVSKRDEIERMVGEAVKALGGLDVLVNNAGIAGETAPVETSDPDKYGALLVVPLTWRWKLQTGAGFDLTPSMHWPTPILATAVADDQRPVLVTVE